MKHQKNFLTLIMLIFVTTSWVFGQQGEKRGHIKDKVKAQRAAYITQQLDLTEDESQKFWPIYNTYQSELEKVRSSIELKTNDPITDKEAEDMMYAILENRTKEIEIQKKYIQKLKSAISSRKIAKLFRVEREFKEKVISHIRDRKKEIKSGK
ncbi:MAG: hypothetical protein IPL08_06765 [Saprospiraceae bacterium]|nr:hypothetical protein [Saprospiraceae bacterium]MBL0102253.1 hypothetical protein [Saprospiraceae bacterium]